MSPRAKVIFRAVGITFASIGILAGVLDILLKVKDGRSLDTYRSGYLVEWSYGAALVAIVILVVGVLVAALFRLSSWLTEKRELKRLVAADIVQSQNRGDR